MTATYEAAGIAPVTYTVELPEGKWTPVMLDIAAVLDGQRPAEVGTLRFTFGSGSIAPIWCDDVVEMEKNEIIVDQKDFSLRERGFQYVVARPMSFRIALRTPEASSQGWRLAEANCIRAIFTSEGKEKKQIIYADGRRFVDGRFDAVGQPRQLLEQSHAQPAEVTLPEETGKLLRNLPGDENNDGYVETEGVYHIVATSPRLEIQVNPRGISVMDPVLDIAGLPAGKVVATVEGKLIEKVVRLDNGHVLIEITGRLARNHTDREGWRGILISIV